VSTVIAKRIPVVIVTRETAKENITAVPKNEVKFPHKKLNMAVLGRKLSSTIKRSLCLITPSKMKEMNIRRVPPIPETAPAIKAVEYLFGTTSFLQLKYEAAKEITTVNINLVEMIAPPNPFIIATMNKIAREQFIKE
jgi:hypothetical protein